MDKITDKYGFRPEWEDEEGQIIRGLIFDLLFKLFLVAFVMAMGIATVLIGVNYISLLNL